MTTLFVVFLPVGAPLAETALLIQVEQARPLLNPPLCPLLQSTG